MMDDSCTRFTKRTVWALVAGCSIWLILAGDLHAQNTPARRFPSVPGWGGNSDSEPRVGSVAHRRAILDSLPLDRLTPAARTQILQIAENPTLFRQLPSQAISCDQDMFLFLTRNPDVLVGLWDLMGITNVQSRRVGPYQIEASDGVGTVCKVDLVYGDTKQHIFVIDGSYDGKMTPTPIRGKGVFVLRSTYAQGSDGQTTVSGTLDCFVQLESLGVDLIARTLSPIIGRSADSNFMQTAHFIAQVSQSSSHNPSAMLDIADRLPQVEPPVRKAFAETIVTVARRGQSGAHSHSARQAAAGQSGSETREMARSRSANDGYNR
ncbi:hypothetical protein [Aporhodopirellula aestuarii]|uniref:Secreted protein n=1 Tax=Aporhodopirellula aestuarii TaxID=2950107 RepID=A0ABT0U5P7_9BACT|nr:hypothetical protein [Aporhodopirellula aestuarii]MCM2372253.1 hypothetical protein [Aporhodopirellula aestuarii]